MACEQDNQFGIIGAVHLDEAGSLDHTGEAPASGLVSITQAAKLNSVTRQAIYVAIKQKKLRAVKTTRWEIDLKDLEDYKRNRYSRKKSVYNGELVFDNEKGYFSVNQVAEMLGVPVQKIYYATRTGAITGSRKGAAWVIHESEIARYKEEYLNKKSIAPKRTENVSASVVEESSN
ncbi:helix-turn-helix domain-containing protein [Chlamydiifrater phoenicopteri]|uniref:helix-turn-helix domain-containing protein n=1 Tax=Chlamydiifrater phoenicopteri TaxID=2681469 RepID=UPI001BCBD440